MTTYVLKKKKKKGPRRGMRFVQTRVDPDRVLAALELRAPPRPSHDGKRLLDPTLPPDITRLTDTQLGTLLGEFSSMAQYVGPRTAMKAMVAASAKRRDKITRSMAHLRQRGTVGDKAALVETDPQVMETSHALLVAESEEAIVAALLESYIIGKEALSRELTRRQKVAENVPGRRGT